MSKTPKKIMKEMALIYEKAWNDVVSSLPPWKQRVITENFEVIDGHHVYKDRIDQRVAKEATKEARIRAEEIIDIKFSGKY